MKIFVQYSQVCTHSEREPEEYGAWSADYDFKVTGVSTDSVNSGKYSRYSTEEEFEVDFDATSGETIWVLSMIYTSGDSFGGSSGNGEVIWVFKTKEAADKAAQAIEDNADEWEINFKLESGKSVKLSNPAAGYFENISALYVEPFVLVGN